MNARLLIVISLALNVVLGGWLVRRATSAAPAPVPRIPRLPIVTEPAPGVPGETNIATATPQIIDADFHWSELVAEDFKLYRDHLRAVGCPEATVRDIILSEIDEHFLQRRKALLADAQRRFWEVASRGERAIKKEWEEPLDKLSDARKQLITDVLGEDPEDEQRIKANQTSRLERDYYWLPEEKRAQLVALETRHQQQVEDYWKEMREHGPDYRPNETESKRLDQMQKDFETARKELLGPEAYDEFRLRHSNAGGWAGRLEAFDITEAEWRAVAKLRMKYDEAIEQKPEPELTSDDAAQKLAAARRRSELNSALEDSIKQTLGEARYDEYRLAQDHDLQETRRITQRYGLSEDVTRQAHQMQRTAMAEAAQIRKNPSLSAEARQAQLAAVRQETERALAETLGGRVFSTYQEYHGAWLPRLEEIPGE